MAFERVSIESPAVEASQFGLFSAADVRPMNDKGWSGLGVQLDNPYGCGPVNSVGVRLCGTPASKNIYIDDQFPTGDAYTVYVNYKCAGPVDYAEARDRAAQALDMGAERGVELKLMTDLLAVATDKTPGSGPVSASAGLALAEGIWAQYGGPMRPLIHADPTTALLSWGALNPQGDHLETKLGSRVAVGAGYFEPAFDETAGTSWVVVTGPMVVLRGEPLVQDPVFVGGSANTDNTFIALAEQNHAWAYLCNAFKIQVNAQGIGSL